MINPKLRKLLDTDEFDWDNSGHREMYLREWVNKGTSAFRDEDDDDREDECPEP